MNAAISVRKLKKSFGGNSVIEGLSFDVAAGEIVAVFGPNGCGKSTTLNIISGIMKQDSGECRAGGFNKSELSYVFQNYRDSLFPWRTNYSNLAFPLELQWKSERQIRERVEETCWMLGVRIDLNQHPYELSGGQQQMLAFARALVSKPRLLLMDEPFSALDYGNNIRMRMHFQKYYLKFRPTTVMVTHDIEEAVHLAGRIVVLSKQPARVARIIDNPEPYPRGIGFLKSKRFELARGMVLSAFRKEASL
jgi:NitT/TauT family transport system ATP-binding protein